MTTIWIASLPFKDDCQHIAHKILLDEKNVAKYTPEMGIYLVTLLLAIMIDTHCIDINHLHSDQLRSGVLESVENPITFTPKQIEQEFIRLNWSLKQMTYFNLRVRRWLVERNVNTPDKIGNSIYLLLKDLDRQANI